MDLYTLCRSLRSIALLDLLGYVACEGAEVDSHQTLSVCGNRFSAVTTLTDALDEWYLPQKGDVKFLGKFLATITTEDIVPILWKFGRSEPSHVLHKANDGYLDMLVEEHTHALDRIGQGYLLGRRDDECPRKSKGLH